jgi:hypothetical protein
VHSTFHLGSRLHLKCDGMRAGTRYRLSAKRTSPFKLVGSSVQSSTGSRGVRIRGSNAGCTMFQGSVRVLATHTIHQFPLHFPSCASLSAITFKLESTDLSDSSMSQKTLEFRVISSLNIMRGNLNLDDMMSSFIISWLKNANNLINFMFCVLTQQPIGQLQSRI